MCNLNLSCQSPDGFCDCGKQQNLTQIFKPVPVSVCSPSESSYLTSLFRIIMQQSESIKAISEQVKVVLDKLSNLSENQTNSGNASRRKDTTASQLQQIISGHDSEYLYKLQPACEIPNPAYKERTFSLMFQIVDNQGKKVVLPEMINFKVMVFTTESPPKAMQVNTNGDKILKGTVEVQGNSAVVFRKIAVKEVTSHFRNGCFFFVVATEDVSYVKPFIVENFVVKARKMNNEGFPKKKQKVVRELESAVSVDI